MNVIGLRTQKQANSSGSKSESPLAPRSLAVCATCRNFPGRGLPPHPHPGGGGQVPSSRPSAGEIRALVRQSPSGDDSNAHHQSRPGRGKESPKEPIGAWGDFCTKLRREMASREVRRLEAAPRAPARYPRPGPALAAPHHVGGAAAVPAAGLGFRNGKVHVP